MQSGRKVGGRSWIDQTTDIKGIDMGPNLVRVRKLEFLYRVLEVRRSSKFDPKFASQKFANLGGKLTVC